VDCSTGIEFPATERVCSHSP